MREPMLDKVEGRLREGVDRAVRAGASAAKTSFSHSEASECGFENARLKDAGSHESCSYSIDVVVAGRRGSASGNRLEHLDRMIDRALELSTVGSAAHFETYPPPGQVTEVKTHSERTLSLTREKTIDSCARIADALKAHNPKLFIICGAGRHESEGLLITSGGVCRQFTGTGWFLHSSVQRTEGSDMLFAGYGRSWCDLNEFYDPDVIIERILTDLRRAEKRADPPRGKVKAFLPPEAVGMLLLPVGLGINGRNVAKGNSPLAGRLGEKVLADSITVVDDPHVDYSNGACETDGSGIPTRRQTLFEKGVLQRFLYDLDSAGLAGAEPTGNSGCGAYWPVFQPGPRPSSELLASIVDGIYIKDLIGFGQSNIINGDFSCNVGLGYRIRNGEIIGRIKDTMIAGNIYELFSKDVELSLDMNHEGRIPYAVIDGLSVSSR